MQQINNETNDKHIVTIVTYIPERNFLKIRKIDTLKYIIEFSFKDDESIKISLQDFSLKEIYNFHITDIKNSFIKINGKKVYFDNIAEIVELF